MRVLITGAAGFIGSHTCNKYVEEGHEVIALDKKLHPDPAYFGNQPLNYGRREYIGGDLKDIDRSFLINLMKDVDVCVHMAAQIDVRRSIEDPCEDAQINIGMTLKLLQCCVEADVKRFIFASSGGAIDGKETPDSPYGIAKLSAEKYLHFFQKHHGLEVVSLRYSNVYGPRQKGGVVSIFTEKMLKNEQVNIYDGRQTRDFVFVKDVAEVNNIALTCEPGTYNISSGTSFSVNEIAMLLKAITGSESELTYHANIKGEVMDSKLAPDSPEGWQATTLLGDGLKQTIEYFKEKDAN